MTPTPTRWMTFPALLAALIMVLAFSPVPVLAAENTPDAQATPTGAQTPAAGAEKPAALPIDPASPLGQLRRLQGKVKAGIELLKNKKPSDALSTLTQALDEAAAAGLPETLPDVGTARLALGLTIMQYGKPQEALPILELLVAKDPQNLAGRHLLAQALAQTGKIDRALAVYAQLGLVAKGNDRLQFQEEGVILGHATALQLAKGGRKAEAVSLLEHTRTQFHEAPRPLQGQLVYTEGYLLEDQGDEHGATDTFEALMQIDPEFDPGNGMKAGQVLARAAFLAALKDLKTGQPDNAGRAVRLLHLAQWGEGDREADVNAALARAYQILGNDAAARRALKKIEDDKNRPPEPAAATPGATGGAAGGAAPAKTPAKHRKPRASSDEPKLKPAHKAAGVVTDGEPAQQH